MILWSFFITAEKIRRAFGFHKIIHLIADVHALTNDFADPATVKASVKNISEKILCAIVKLGLSGVYDMKLASELAKEPGYFDELRAIDGPEHDYVKQELADMNFLRKNHSVALKLSWQQESTRIECDERFFDNLFIKRFGSCMSFVYLKAGRSFDVTSLNVCPYTAKAGQTRILIGSGKTASEIIEEMSPPSKSTRHTFKHLQNIVDEFEEVFGAILESDKDLGSRIEAIIAHVFF